MIGFPKNRVLFGGFPKMSFSKKIEGFLKKMRVSRDFQGNQGKYTQVSRASDLTGWHVWSYVTNSPKPNFRSDSPGSAGLGNFSSSI